MHSGRAADAALSCLDDLEIQVESMRSTSNLMDLARIERLSRLEAVRLADLYSEYQRLERIGEGEPVSFSAPSATLIAQSVMEGRPALGDVRSTGSRSLEVEPIEEYGKALVSIDPRPDEVIGPIEADSSFDGLVRQQVDVDGAVDGTLNVSGCVKEFIPESGAVAGFRAGTAAIMEV